MKGTRHNILGLNDCAKFHEIADHPFRIGGSLRQFPRSPFLGTFRVADHSSITSEFWAQDGILPCLLARIRDRS